MKISIILPLLIILLFTQCAQLPKNYYAKVKKDKIQYDVIIVPGFPFEVEESDSSWSKVMEVRVHWAKILWDQGITKNIIFSGGAIYTKYSECKIMKLYAIEMGIPAENIFLDSLAEHSTENVYYSYYLAKHHNFKKIAVATDPYQTRMVRSFVKNMNERLKTNIQLLPTMLMKTVPHYYQTNYKINHKEAITSNFVNITKTQSFKHRIRGTFGKNIDWENPPTYKK